ncbi:MAG: aminotransferase class V-fold PLP-dependent enzyme [Gaiellaceae bacterium]
MLWAPTWWSPLDTSGSARLRARASATCAPSSGSGSTRPFVGWKSTEDAVAFDATTIPLARAARRLEYSTPAYAAGAALTAAVDYLLGLGVENVLEHDLALTAELREGLVRLGAEVLTPVEDDRRAGIVIARFPGREGPEVASALAEADVIVSPRLGAVRFSCHHFNDSSDVEQALVALGEIL